ncbi:hypothetical protein MATL_G00100870 [Megalops atlanticus]|uniref:Sushi domain-containing protein n=1 Tax=Megalops atlanticus TaxID=7932 RepID=A0A9D3Q1S0_MEGAT|nr:hypothetical protein MATL_G00100870 [Megalops atlanticus]
MDRWIQRATCGLPLEVENAGTLGNRRDRYAANSVIRYQRDPGFTKHHLPVVRCMADGLWERPRVECVGHECILLLNM